MAEFGECGESDYAMITLADLFDLRHSRIIMAQIINIDPATNSAHIYVAEECPELEGKDLTNVPFFYHCEDSTGTIEDLERGFMAFSEGQRVIALYSPANKGVEERFFIVGHADIRTLEKCEITEYLYIRSMSTWGLQSFYCIFDPVKGELLDIESFENIDDESPEKPSAAIGEFNYPLQNWLNYNFTYAESWPVVPHNFSLINEGAYAGVPIKTEEGGIQSLGWMSQFWGNQPRPEGHIEAAEEWKANIMSIPEQHYSHSTDYSGLIPKLDPELQLLLQRSEESTVVSSPSVCEELGDTGYSVSGYYPHRESAASFMATAKPGAELGFKLTDSVLETEFKGLINYHNESESAATTESSCGETYGRYDSIYNKSGTHQYRAWWDFSAFNGSSADFSISGSYTKRQVTVNGELVEDSLIGNDFSVEHAHPPQVSLMSGVPFRIGRLGVYLITGSVFYSVPYEPVGSDFEIKSKNVHFVPCVMVSLFDNTVRPGDTVTLSQCVANANHDTSSALANAIAQLMQMVNDHIVNNNIAIDVYDYYDLLREYGLNISIITKKKI